ncbi:MAG: SMP-30/gluconolactonase/LRE family protein [Streptosporangiaceae bacterium]
MADTGGFILGIAFDGTENIYACDMARHALLRIDPRSGEVEDLTTGRSEFEIRTPNYAVFHPDGRLFFSDSGAWGSRDGRIYCRHPDGTISLVSHAAPAFTNGLAIDPDTHWLYVAESEVPRISRLAITAAGLSGCEVVLEMPRTVPDGLAFAADGRLLVGCYRPDAVMIWDGSNREVLIDDWTGENLAGPTNLAFIGEGLSRLVAANLGGYHIAEFTALPAGLTGAPLNYPSLST